jgi:predicted nuclease of restriction endonuclease-like RecB superfamily
MKGIHLSISTFFCQSINITFSTLQQARLLLDERNLNELVHPWLGSTYNVSQVQAMIAAAALCVQQSSQHRPQISQVRSFPKQVHAQ